MMAADDDPNDARALAVDVLGRDLTADDDALLAQLATLDWKRTRWFLDDGDDRARAARAFALGVPVFYGFANFYALSFHPSRHVMRSVNAMKGRPVDQVASVTTTLDRAADLFDWRALPRSLSADTVWAVMKHFLERGPFGFRGPASPDIPAHLTTGAGERRTVQLIAPGVRCPSNALIVEATEQCASAFLAITSANVSGSTTGREEPAHYRVRGIRDDFGETTRPLAVLAHRHERRVRAAYRDYAPMSTSILGFYEDLRGEPPGLTIERWGSLDIGTITRELVPLGVVAYPTEQAQHRLPQKRYARTAPLPRALARAAGRGPRRG